MTEQPVFDRYEIKELLGKGGMATVYHAIDTRFDRDVAIKVLPREFMSDDSFFRRFEREAQTIAALEHPAIVPVYDFGENDGQPFLVMGYMAGGTLADRIKRGPLPLKDAAQIMGRVAEALDWAHSQDIIHRDVKPANILFDRHGFAYLADFGIVLLGQSTAHLTGTGVIGTPGYMAPEMMGEGGLTHLIDIYALGVTLYEMLAGMRPYRAPTAMGLLMAHVNKPIPNICEVRPDLPESVQAMIEWGMAKDPAERCQSAGELAEGVAESIAEDEITSLPETAGATRRLSWAWIGGIGMAVIAGIVALIVLLGGGSAPPAAPEPTQTAVIIAEEETPAPTIAPTATPTDQPTPVPPTPTTTPTPEPTLHPILALAEAGVSSNDEWEPYIGEFNGASMALVPAGCFMMGSEDGGDSEKPVHEVCFRVPYWIDVYEVTNADFAAFLNEEGNQTEGGAPWLLGASDYGRIWESSGLWVVNSGSEDIAAIAMTWYGARAYCEWRGVRLPTEAEWEYAARGPDGLLYPWGNEFWGDYVVYGANHRGGPAEVGSRLGGVSWVRAYDLSGNVEELVNDWYGESYYYYAGSLAENPQGPTGGEYRGRRGGSWFDDAYALRAIDRGTEAPNDGSKFTGFRCARSYDG